jgi:hypothetical protein
MMFVRRRPLLRAAAVGGTAYMMGRNRAQQQAERAEMDAEQDRRLGDLEDQPAPHQPAPPPAQPASAAPPSPLLDQLAALRQQGALSDEEFTAAKAKLLGS